MKRVLVRILADAVVWSNAGGIVGRGVLLDYVAYAKRHNINYDPTDKFTFSEKDLDKIAEESNITFRNGDILLVRSGYVGWHDNASHEERLAGAKKQGFGGLDTTPASREWLWNHHFAAVAGDSPGFEAMPPNGDFFMVGW